jgi:A/G-specific adenine glycosylase
VKSFQSSLLAWYRRNKRDLPWRKTRDPYRILVSEIMLQQTQVDTVIPYYHRFLKSFPSFQALARAPLGKVLKHWEGLGYYTRARNLHALAKTVVRDCKGRLPRELSQLRQLPGIGPYTAGAIASIAFKQDCAVLDGNVERVLARLGDLRHDLRSGPARQAMWQLAESLVPTGEAGDYNQAVMDLGATICTPATPRCPPCPVRGDCRAHQHGSVAQIPFKRKTKKLPHFHIGAGVVWKDERILISQRPLKGLLGGLWEFPGGKKERGESLSECVAREIGEELGVKVRVGKKLAAVKHAYSHFKITLHIFDCHYLLGEPQALGCKAWKWVRRQDLKRFAFPAANQPVIRRLAAIG